MFASGILPDRHTIGLGLALLACMLWIAFQDHLIFHALIEIFIVLATWGIFVTAWNSRYIVRDPCISFLGDAYLFVGLFELLHMLSDKSISVFLNNADLSTQLQIIARCMQSASLFIAPFFMGKTMKNRYVFAVFSAITACLLLSVFYWHNFPACFIGGTVPT